MRGALEVFFNPEQLARELASACNLLRLCIECFDCLSVLPNNTNLLSFVAAYSQTKAEAFLASEKGIGAITSFDNATMEENIQFAINLVGEGALGGCEDFKEVEGYYCDCSGQPLPVSTDAGKLWSCLHIPRHVVCFFIIKSVTLEIKSQFQHLANSI